ncbi:helix-turn-helix domain-containing protein [Aquimarina celericrescens]|uniref:Helix-turn-helix domain-containing protein n=1 Tax=Aquimarina celericrescens TaxID=1964542 RepID=A0ABW5AT67_9FLAO|nr:helix-turn-helix domain-containing protein [Aquimarina celericrescens]
MYFKSVLLVLLILLVKYKTGYAQGIPDTLLYKSNSELLSRFHEIGQQNIKALYMNAYIQKGRINNDTLIIIDGFSKLSELYTDEKSIKYADSIIMFTEKNPTSFYPAGAYITIGEHYFDSRKMKLALDNFLVAHDLAQNYFNRDIFYGSNHMIGLLKDRIGYSEEALAIHKENLEFAKEHFDQDTGQLLETTSIHAIAFTYKNLGKLDSALYYNNRGLEKSKHLKFKPLTNYFLLNQGVIFYQLNKLDQSKISIEKALMFFEETNNWPNMAEGYFYLAKIYHAQNQKEESMTYFKKMDSIFLKNNDLLPEAREGYEMLIEYYKEKENPAKQLDYLERLIILDSILNSNRVYLGDNIKDRYDIPKLIAQKEDLIDELKGDKIDLKYIAIGICSALVIVILGLYFRQRTLKKKFNVLMNQDEVNKTLEVEKRPDPEKGGIDIPQNIANDILNRLNTFIKNEGFTDNKITLSSLAKSYQTNSTYLSKTINHYYNKSFTNYLNDLRVNYALEKLKTDSSFRKWTIKAIAQNSGFKSAETFSKLFKAKNGIYPSYFIKQINNVELKQISN